MATVLDCARISSDVYNASNLEAPGWQRGAVYQDQAVGEGFFGATYSRGAEVVIAYRGSVERVDWTDADADIARGALPLGQLADAMSYANSVVRAATQRGITRVIITGHSLGGGLAQLSAAIRTNAAGVSFNAPGCRSLSGPVALNFCNNDVWNYRTMRDPVSLRGVHVGRPPVSLPVPTSALEQASAVLGVGGRVVGYLAGSANEHRMAPMMQALAANGSVAGRVI